MSPGWWRRVEASRTPLQENLDRLGATLGKAALGVVALVVAIGLARGLPVIDMFMFGIALAVAVVPEALPAVVTISLAIGVRRMVKRNALVRRLPIVETLGSTSVICTDKTGTVTRNEMTVRQVLADERLFELSGAGYDPAGQVLEAGQVVEPTAWRACAAARRRPRVGCAARLPRRPLAGGGRPHRGCAHRGGDQGGIESGRSQSAGTAHRGDPVHVGAAPDDHASHDGVRRRGVLERGGRRGAGQLHEPAAVRRGRATDGVRSRAHPRVRATHGRRRPSRARGREKILPHRSRMRKAG